MTAKRGRAPGVSRMGYNPANFEKLYGGFGLIRIPVDASGRATARRIWRKFEGQPERMIFELPDNVTTKYQDDVR